MATQIVSVVSNAKSPTVEIAWPYHRRAKSRLTITLTIQFSTTGGGRLVCMRPRRIGLAAAAMTMLVVTGCSSGSGAPAPSAGPSTDMAAPATPSSESAASAGPGTSADWPTYHGSMDRSGLSTTMPAATGALRRIHALKLDGAVYASPLIVRGLTIVATENNSVYAFDQSYKQVWKRHLGSPSPAEQRQCGDIDPLGITGTPIYDSSTDRVYVVAEQGGSVRHELFALDRGTGAVAWSNERRPARRERT